MFGLYFGMQHFMSFLALQSYWQGREIWLLCFNCLYDVVLLLILCGCSLWCREIVCSVCDCGISLLSFFKRMVTFSPLISFCYPEAGF